MQIVNEFTDIETAKTSGRTKFTEMLKFLKKNKTVKIILVEKTDRLYRNFKDYTILEDLDLEVHLVKEGEIISKNSTSHSRLVDYGSFVAAGGDGQDSIYGGDRADIISGNCHPDSLFPIVGFNDNDYLDGAGSDDTIYGYEGKNDYILGGSGNDIIYGDREGELY